MNVAKRYNELLEYLVEPKTSSHVGDKTICYLTFGVEDILDVKRHLKSTWISLAKNKGFEPEILSMHEVTKDFFSKDDYRIDAGEDAVDNKSEMLEVYASLGNNLDQQRIIDNAILEAQGKLKGNGVLLITDVEALHPFSRFGPIEQRLYSKIEKPIVVFYPGKKSGSALRFLGVYPEDGNYRSKHF